MKMKCRKKVVFFSLITASILLCSVVTYAWRSTWFSLSWGLTHRSLTAGGIGVVKAQGSIAGEYYPDIPKFFDVLVDGSNDELAAHDWKLWSNFGNPDKLWQEINVRYEKGNFISAYKYLGSLVHLVQDQAVPAHTFDIYHIVYRKWGGLNSGDGVENYANAHYGYNTPSLAATDPVGAFGDVQRETRITVINNNPEAPSGETWSMYWQGGRYGDKEFPSSRSDQNYKSQHDNLARNQITLAINYSAGLMAAASRLLPPLTRNLEIHSSYTDEEGRPVVEISV